MDKARGSVRGAAIGGAAFVLVFLFQNSTQSPAPLSANSRNVVVADARVTSNGTAFTWDGKVLIQTSGSGWNAFALRPMNILRGPSGELLTVGTENTNVNARTWSSSQPLLRLIANAPVNSFRSAAGLDGLNGMSILHHLNAIAVVPVLAPGQSPLTNPVRQACSVTDQALCDHYDMYVYTQLYRSTDSAPRHPAFAHEPSHHILGRMRLRIGVKGPDRNFSRIAYTHLVEDFQPLSDTLGRRIQGIEPTLTVDGRLMIWNLNAPDKIMYSLNLNGGALNGWTPPRDIADLYWVDRDTRIDGVSVSQRYSLARAPLRTNLGETFFSGQPLKGAYPWLSWEGSDLFLTTLQRQGGTRQAGLAVIGRWTGHRLHLIDAGPATEVWGEERAMLFTGGVAATGSIWNPFKGVNRPAFPRIPGDPAYFILQGTSGRFAELNFRDFTDGRYAAVYGFTPALNRVPIDSANRDTELAWTRTPDSSGNDGHGTLLGAPWFVSSWNGFHGQALWASPAEGVTVPHNAALDSLQSFSVELAIRPLVDLSATPTGSLSLVRKFNSFDIVLEGNRQIQASVWINGQRRRTGFIGPQLPLNQWSHVALTYNHTTAEVRVYVDGNMIFSRVHYHKVPVGKDPSAPLLLGPSGVNMALTTTGKVVGLDEVKISQIERTAADFQDARFVPLTNRLPVEAPIQNRRLAQAPLRQLASAPVVSATSVVTSNSSASGALIQLGADLFSDPSLSRTGTVACSSCHVPSRNFQDGLRVSPGVSQAAGFRNTPSVVNRAFGLNFNWDARFPSLATQSSAPILAGHEMNYTEAEVVARVSANAGYATRFNTMSPPGVNRRNIEAALGAFIANLYSAESRADLYELGLNSTAAFTPDEVAGRDLFFGKARCAACHGGPNWTDEQFHNVGLIPSPGDGGLHWTTGRSSDARLFKTPSLRNVAHTAPYFHDGSVADLDSVIALYDSGGIADPTRDDEIRPLGLTSLERTQLGAYLRTLSSATLMRLPASVTTPGRCGTSEGGRFLAATDASLLAGRCASGTPSAVVASSTDFSWTCPSPEPPGAAVTCRAARILPVAGQCANVPLLPRPVTTNETLCMVGNMVNFAGSGPWTWTCQGTNGGANVNCSAPDFLTCPTNFVPGFLPLTATRAEKVRNAYCLVLRRKAGWDPFYMRVNRSTLMESEIMDLFRATEMQTVLGGHYLSVSNESFLTAAYQRILGRNPDPDGFAAHLAALRNGRTRDNHLLMFIRSGEFQTRFGSLAQ